MGVPKISDLIQIKIKMPNPSQEPPASFKIPNQYFKDMDVLCTFKIKIPNWNSANWCIKDHWPHPNWDQDGKPQSGTSSVLQRLKSGLEGHVCSLHLKNQDSKLKIRKLISPNWSLNWKLDHPPIHPTSWRLSVAQLIWTGQTYPSKFQAS